MLEDKDVFWIGQRTNKAGKLWGRQFDEERYQYSRPGDMILAPFQCERCWFVNIHHKEPTKGCGQDECLLFFIRRVNLDVMWSKEPGTVKSALGQYRKAKLLSEELGLPSPNFPPKGPWPVCDAVGMSTCLVMLKASTKKGSYSMSHQQYDTIRKLRSVYTCLYQSSILGEEQGVVFAGEKGRKYRTAHGETESIFYKLFNAGLDKRMDKDKRSDLALEFKLLIAVLDRVERELHEEVTEVGRRRFLIIFGAFLVIGYGGSLRGNEGFFVEAKSLINNIHEGITDPEHPHVVVELFGRFKGETNEATSTLILANVTNGGLHIRRWVERLAGVLLLEGALEREGTHVPAICEASGELMERRLINNEFMSQLEEIQKEEPELMSSKIKVRQRYSINRSLRRGSRTRAQVKRVDEDIIELINRWSKFEAVRGRPALSMYEHYAEMKQLLEIYVIYSESL